MKTFLQLQVYYEFGQCGHIVQANDERNYLQNVVSIMFQVSWEEQRYVGTEQ